MHRRADFSERGGPAPMTGRSANDRVNIHESHEGPSGPRVGQCHRLARPIADLRSVSGQARRRCQAGFENLGAEGRQLNLSDNGRISGHKLGKNSIRGRVDSRDRPKRLGAPNEMGRHFLTRSPDESRGFHPVGNSR